MTVLVVNGRVFWLWVLGFELKASSLSISASRGHSISRMLGFVLLKVGN